MVKLPTGRKGHARAFSRESRVTVELDHSGEYNKSGLQLQAKSKKYFPGHPSTTAFAISRLALRASFLASL